MIKGAVHNFHLSKTNLLHRISPLQFKKKKRVFLFVNTDVISLFNERTLFTTSGRGEGSGFFLKALFIKPCYLITVLEFHKQ